MKYHLSRRAVLKWLETPSIYHLAKDELYELDKESFRFMRNCMGDEGCDSADSAFIDYCMDEGLLTREQVNLARPALIQPALPSLRYLELQITDTCNLRCKHCYMGETPGHELPPKQVMRVLGEFQKMQGLRVLISGGEPLMHSRFAEINEMLPDFFLRKVLFTNGVLLGKERLKTIKVDEIQVSIDGLAASHDAIRGAGMFEKTLAAVRHALDAGFDVSVSTMVHRLNMTDFDAMERIFKDLGVKDWTVDVPCLSGRLREHQDLMVTPAEGGKLLGYGFGGGVHASSQGHGCGLHLMAVMADGVLAKCSFYQDRPIGRVEDGLQPSWQRLKPILLENLACDCEFLEICRGGCRYRAELAEGKRGKDPYRCKLYGIL
jgi:radical SAM protein with 4Fe4S-binding SPASM domain